ncbi:dihydroorotase [bacterium]|nr:dihydroorotase [bacterium]
MTLRCIRGGRIIDPSQSIDQEGDLWIEDQRIRGVGNKQTGQPYDVIDARGMIVVPGLVDMHVHLCEPGDENNETIETGTKAALESGFTSLAVMPDTEPAIDTQSSAEFITAQAKRAGHVNVFPIGALTKGRKGEELAEMGGLLEGGAVAFSDSDRPVANAEIMRRGLEYATMLNKAVLSRPEVEELTRRGIMNEGNTSVALGMPGIPTAAEQIQVDRDLHLAKWTGAKLHLQSLSCEGSVESVRRAQAEQVPVTAEANPHHFILTDVELRSFDSNFKVNPPLRSERDVRAVIRGLKDGTISVIASDHSPFATELKLRELDEAPFGIIGIETMLPLCIKHLVHPGHLTWPQLIEKLAFNPARVLGINRGTLREGRPADVTIIDPNEEWTIDCQRFRSRSRNSPFHGWTVRGRVAMVLVAGHTKYVRPGWRATEASLERR